MSDNLAEFFIRKYEELEEEVRDLRETYCKDEGFSDFGCATYAVRCSVLDRHGMFSPLSNWGEYGIEDLEELLLMTDAELLEEAKAPCDFKGYEIIKMITRRFPFTVKFESYKGQRFFGYDPDEDAHQLHEITSDETFDSWAWRSKGKALEEHAVKVVREGIAERIEKLKKREEN